MNAIFFPKTCSNMVKAISNGKPYTANNIKVSVVPYGFNVYLYGVLLASIDTLKREIYLEATKHNLTTLKYLHTLIEYYGLNITVALSNKNTLFIQNNNININSIKVIYGL